jgi:hypothetical protein
MINIFKKLYIPKEEKTSIVAYKSWVVRWESRHTEYSGGTRPEAEIFPSKEDAMSFKKQLEEAFKLLRYTCPSTYVTIEENQSKLATLNND